MTEEKKAEAVPPRPYTASVVGGHCPSCGKDWSHRRFLNTVWGAVWLQCLSCGEERKAT